MLRRKELVLTSLAGYRSEQRAEQTQALPISALGREALLLLQILAGVSLTCCLRGLFLALNLISSCLVV